MIPETDRPRRALPLGLAALLAVALTALALFTAGRDRPGSRADRFGLTAAVVRTPGTSPVPLGAAGSPRTTRLGYQAGDRLTYRFEADRTLQLSATRPLIVQGKAVESRPVDLEFRLSGLLDLRVYGADRDGWSVGFSIRDADLARRGPQTDPTADRLLARALEIEVLARIDSLGSIDKLILPDGLSAEAGDCWREVLIHWRMVLDPDPEVDTWETEEEDSTGRFRARYERTGSSEGGTVQLCKRKLEYIRIESDGSIPCEGPVAIDGETRFLLDPLPLRVAGHERLRIDVEAAGRRIESALAFQFVRVAHERHAAGGAVGQRAVDLLRSRVGSSLVEVEDTARDAPANDDARTRAREMLAALDGLLASGREFSIDEHRVMVALILTLRSCPAASLEVAERLEGSDCGERLVSALATCLAAAGTPTAQEVLIGLLQRADWGEGRLRCVLHALAHVEHPLPGFDSVLGRLSERQGDTAGTALLLLGALGSRVRESDRQRFLRIQQSIEEALDSSRTESALLAALGAARNLGPSRVPQAVREAMGSRNATIRFAGALALLRVGGKEPDRLLVQAATEDEVARVRHAALKTLVERHSRGCGHAEALPRPLNEIIARMASTDPDESVRELAKRSLGSLRELTSGA